MHRGEGRIYWFGSIRRLKTSMNGLKNKMLNSVWTSEFFKQTLNSLENQWWCPGGNSQPVPQSHRADRRSCAWEFKTKGVRFGWILTSNFQICSRQLKRRWSTGDRRISETLNTGVMISLFLLFTLETLNGCRLRLLSGKCMAKMSKEVLLPIVWTRHQLHSAVHALDDSLRLKLQMMPFLLSMIIIGLFGSSKDPRKMCSVSWLRKEARH